MPERTDLVYLCDCSLEGVLCCVFESYTRRETPFDILPDGSATLFPSRQIVTDEQHARRVYQSLARISDEVRDWVESIYLSCVSGRELLIYRFIRLAYSHGARVTAMLNDPLVSAAFKAKRALGNEAHLLIEFLRFSDYGGALAAEIEPKGLVLPLMAPHFTGRFPEEQFMIFDRTHGMALFYRPYESVIRPVDEVALPAADQTERAFRALWRRYYDAIGIEGRFNPKCRMTHMPKHFWKHMTELSDRQALEDSRNGLRIPAQRGDAVSTATLRE